MESKINKKSEFKEIKTKEFEKTIDTLFKIPPLTNKKILKQNKNTQKEKRK